MAGPVEPQVACILQRESNILNRPPGNVSHESVGTRIAIGVAGQYDAWRKKNLIGCSVNIEKSDGA